MTSAISVASAQPSIRPVPVPAALTHPPTWVTFVSGCLSQRWGGFSTVTEFKFILSDTKLYAANQYISWALQACPVPFCSNAPQMWRGGVGALESPRCQGLLKPPTTTGLQPVILSTGEVNKAAWASSAWITDSEWCLFVSAHPVFRLHPGKPRQLATEWAEIGFSS